MSRRVPISPKYLEEQREEIKPLTTVFDLINTHVVISDIHGNILYMNKAAEVSTGYTEKESLGKNPGDLWGGNESEEFFKKMWQTIKYDRKSFTGIVENVRKDGTHIKQQLNITPVLDSEGKVEHFIAVEVDVTREVVDKSTLEHKINTLLNSMVTRENKMIELKKQIETLSHSS